MIDTKELRRLAQAATPNVGRACNYQNEHWIREGHVDFENADLFIASERPQEDAAFYAAANPATISELLDRLEAAEKERDELRRCFNEWIDKTEWVQRGINEGTISPKYLGLHRADVMASLLGAAEKERDALRAKIEAMENQEPVTLDHIACVDNGVLRFMTGRKAPAHDCELYAMPNGKTAPKLYALPGAQQCKNCNGMGDRFDPSGEKIPCDLCESNLEEIRVLVAEAAHDIISGSDFWLSTSLAAKKIYALPGAKGDEK